MGAWITVSRLFVDAGYHQGSQTLEHPLAVNLDVLAGQARVFVPTSVVPGDNYQILRKCRASSFPEKSKF